MAALADASNHSDSSQVPLPITAEINYEHLLSATSPPEPPGSSKGHCCAHLYHPLEFHRMLLSNTRAAANTPGPGTVFCFPYKGPQWQICEPQEHHILNLSPPSLLPQVPDKYGFTIQMQTELHLPTWVRNLYCRSSSALSPSHFSQKLTFQVICVTSNLPLCCSVTGLYALLRGENKPNCPPAPSPRCSSSSGT